MQGIKFMETAEVDVDLGSMRIKASLPVLDRHSLLSYAIAQHVHWTLAPHRGVETCNRVSLENVHIIQGVGLYREIAENCPSCAIKRKMYMQGTERNTRSGFAALDSKWWIMVKVCPTTRLVNMQVFERSLADGLISGVTR
jgi:hypothetical protein